ncbi:hypothetical protein PTNB73_08484 [Pyrenophora teres f. teres]|uniref:Uncharacterized protein n=2 Tax=Pyrenophora teres f. teres TaxID=97479 RepID=E3S356_PYRTT|nr:hypothetical protein PTT_16856 [Pyrenophora teres f. teres 0-1]KAE8825484.1 hypothetical protein HRS9139_08594 [Pyrenophora teres f. teres]KAE8834580.1 hypothetical protein PTNB85_05913 [Pyrenophora teres f. teres]KAE8843940.1 hypothetical protein HRS9122_05043 [Pyrenophora teres f. teres]KAE8859004.1 hypothetical protein PTNB73_08484 [Pyrenophora teres f. teres]
MSDHDFLYENPRDEPFTSTDESNAPITAPANDTTNPTPSPPQITPLKATDSDVPPIQLSPTSSPPRQSYSQRLTDPFSDYASVLDSTRGPLRTTSDGNLLEEESGDWLILATPPHSADDRELALLQTSKPTTKLPVLWMPECKNGATAFDNPRTRKPLARLLRNKWTGSDRSPAVEPKTNREELREEAARALVGKGERVDEVLLGRIRENFDTEMKVELGRHWYERAVVGYVSREEVLRVVAGLETET